MINFPTAYITGMTRALRSTVLATESPFSFVQQVQDTGGERWEFSIDVMVQGLGFEVFANAVINKRKFFNLAIPKPRGQSRNQYPVLKVGGGGQVGNTLSVWGTWDGGALKAGDMFSFVENGRHRLHQLTADATPYDGALGTLQFVPRLRGSPADHTEIEVISPKVTLRANNRSPATIGHVIHQFSIEAVEAL